MKLKFFAIPALFPEAGEAELNRFLDGHQKMIVPTLQRGNAALDAPAS
ncbi:MAG: hypothetical protein WC091_22815 [Sulfuricellaceae bacterium]